MAIVAAQRGNAEGTAWVLANATLESLRDASTAALSHTEINNTFRLLEAYGGSEYFAAPQPSLYPNVGRVTSLSSSNTQGDMVQVALAIGGALSDSFGEIAKETAVSIIGDVLRYLYNNQLGELEFSQINKTIAFFESMKGRLESSI